MTAELTGQALQRYRRQVILPQIGPEGQQKLSGSSVLQVGAGATGSLLADMMVRAGIGRITIIDRDFVELHNLHRQFAYTEKDIGQPKAQRLARRLEEVNSGVQVGFQVGELDHRNARDHLDSARADLVMDATDNIYSRQILNEACFEKGVPWVYCGATGTTGMAAAFPFSGDGYDGPCFRCLVPVMPPPGTVPTCESAGILNSAAAAAASMAVTQGTKLLLERPVDGLLILDIWASDFQRIDIPKRLDCPCCVDREFDFLQGRYAPRSMQLCGEGTYQMNFPEKMRSTDFDELKVKLSGKAGLENFMASDWHFSFTEGEVEITIFRDGRMLARGVDSVEAVRTLFDRFIGL